MSEDVKLGGTTYRIGMLPGRTAAKVFFRLARVMGSAIGVVSDPKQLKSKQIEIIARAANYLKDEDLDFLIDHFAEVTSIQTVLESAKGPRAIYTKIADDAFNGHPLLLMGWIIAAIKVNFANFTEDLTALSALMPEDQENGTTEEKT